MKVLRKLREFSEVEWFYQPLSLMHSIGDFLLPNWDAMNNIRCLLMKLFGLKIHASSKLGKGVAITKYGNLRVGAHSSISPSVYLDTFRPIRIGKGCSIGFRSCLVTGTHVVQSDYLSQRPLDLAKSRPIEIEDFVWIGANATILPGVRIGRGAVVAAGAVVAKDVEPATIVAGVPAKVVRVIEQSNIEHTKVEVAQ